MKDKKVKGYVSFVLHAHLPFIHHPESEDYLEEQWLFEAISETYIPLILNMNQLIDEGVDFRLTMNISPPLLNMLDNKLLQERYIKYLNLHIELAQKEIQRALEKDRGDWRLYHLASVAAAKTDDAERRLEALSGAQRALDGAAQIYFDLSLLWLSLGIESKAQEFKEKCLALDKSYLELY